MTTTRPTLLLSFVLVVLAATQTASAYDVGSGWGGSTPFGVWGYGFSGNLYGLGRIPTPPYFALHPPVYYNHRTPRPYGDSPFAHPTGQYAQVPPATTVVIVNPYVPQVAAPEGSTAAARGQVIENPHVRPADASPSDTNPATSSPDARLNGGISQR